MSTKDFFSLIIYFFFGSLIRKYKSREVIKRLEFYESPYVDYNGNRFYNNIGAKGSTYYFSVSYETDKVILFKPNGKDIIDILYKPFVTEKVERLALNADEKTTYYYKCTFTELSTIDFFKFVNTLVYTDKVKSGDKYHKLIRDNVGLDEYKHGKKVHSWGYNHHTNKYINSGYYDGSNPITRYHNHDSGKSISTMDDSIKADNTETYSGSSYSGSGGGFGGSGAGSSFSDHSSSSSGGFD